MHTSVKFKKQWGKYNGGETAGFSAEELAKIPTEVYELAGAEESKPAAPAAPVETPVTPTPPTP